MFHISSLVTAGPAVPGIGAPFDSCKHAIIDIDGPPAAAIDAQPQIPRLDVTRRQRVRLDHGEFPSIKLFPLVERFKLGLMLFGEFVKLFLALFADKLSSCLILVTSA